MITREMHDLACRRVEFLTDRVGLQSMPVLHILANAYVQGMIDASEFATQQEPTDD